MQFPIQYLGDYINGYFKAPEREDGRFNDLSPADLGDEIMEVPFSYHHIDEASSAAKLAYKTWSRLPLSERKVYLKKLEAEFINQEARMAECISRDTGKPLWEALTEAKALSQKVQITLEASLKLVEGESIDNILPGGGVTGVVRYKSRGVMAVIGPFNFPAHLPNGHIIPALIMGNTIVFKPSEQTPAVGQLYAEIVHKAGFPSGVFNMVQGDGEAGKRLAAAELVDGILFTGSYEVGLKIKQETLTHYWKILALEMGGKNASVIWQDADLDKAVYETLVGSFMTSGQRCSCTSRILVHESIADIFIDRFYEASKKLKIGHWSENPFMGPLINHSAVEKYLRFQEIAKREGAESLMRGKVLELSKKGFYVTPSIYLLKSFDEKSVYQKSEIFGPNVSILRVREFGEAMEVVNSTGYGLVMSLFSKSRELYEQAVLDANVGLLNWNRTTNGASSRLPFGGTGKSGNDRPSAHFAINYCSVPMANLEDASGFDAKKVLPGMNYA